MRKKLTRRGTRSKGGNELDSGDNNSRMSDRWKNSDKDVFEYQNEGVKKRWQKEEKGD